MSIKVMLQLSQRLSRYAWADYNKPISLGYADEILRNADDREVIVKAFDIIITTPGWISSRSEVKRFENVDLPPNWAISCILASKDGLDAVDVKIREIRKILADIEERSKG